MCICMVNATCVWYPRQPVQHARSLGAGVIGGCGKPELGSSGKAASVLSYILSHLSSPMCLEMLPNSTTT